MRDRVGIEQEVALGEPAVEDSRSEVRSEGGRPARCAIAEDRVDLGKTLEQLCRTVAITEQVEDARAVDGDGSLKLGVAVRVEQGDRRVDLGSRFGVVTARGKDGRAPEAELRLHVVPPDPLDVREDRRTALERLVPAAELVEAIPDQEGADPDDHRRVAPMRGGVERTLEPRARRCTVAVHERRQRAVDERALALAGARWGCGERLLVQLARPSVVAAVKGCRRKRVQE